MLQLAPDVTGGLGGDRAVRGEPAGLLKPPDGVARGGTELLAGDLTGVDLEAQTTQRLVERGDLPLGRRGGPSGPITGSIMV
ncbi:hypothetical protein GCM10029992_50840 [Glycomyces albus]